jgi:hypothetical protein
MGVGMVDGRFDDEGGKSFWGWGGWLMITNAKKRVTGSCPVIQVHDSSFNIFTPLPKPPLSLTP